MKQAYPVVLIPEEVGYTVYIPDFDSYTEGEDLAEAIYMAEEAIGILGIDMQDDEKEIPTGSTLKDIDAKGNDVALVAVDFDEYRRKIETKVVKKNCTVPGWLCYAAEKANINFSKVLQDGLKRELQIAEV